MSGFSPMNFSSSTGWRTASRGTSFSWSRQGPAAAHSREPGLPAAGSSAADTPPATNAAAAIHAVIILRIVNLRGGREIDRRPLRERRMDRSIRLRLTDGSRRRTPPTNAPGRICRVRIVGSGGRNAAADPLEAQAGVEIAADEAVVAGEADLIGHGGVGDLSAGLAQGHEILQRARIGVLAGGVDGVQFALDLLLREGNEIAAETGADRIEGAAGEAAGELQVAARTAGGGRAAGTAGAAAGRGARTRIGALPRLAGRLQQKAEIRAALILTLRGVFQGLKLLRERGRRPYLHDRLPNLEPFSCRLRAKKNWRIRAVEGKGARQIMPSALKAYALRSGPTCRTWRCAAHGSVRWRTAARCRRGRRPDSPTGTHNCSNA